MKGLKRMLALALCLLLILPAGALAAEGDAIVARRNTENYNEGFQDYIAYMTSQDETLYLFGSQNGIYTYHVGEADVTLAYPMEMGNQVLMDALNEAMPTEVEAEGVDTYVDTTYGFFARDGKLYLLASVTDSWQEGEGDELEYHQQVREEAVLFEINLGDEQVAVSVADTYDWTDMIEQDSDYSYSYSGNGSVYMDGKLFIRSYDSNWDDVVYCLDLESGDLEIIDALSNAQSICAYKDNTLLAVLFSYENPTEATLLIYDPAAGSDEEVLTLTVPEYSYPQGLAADPEDGAVFMSKQGAIWKLDLETGEETEICDMPIESYGNVPTLIAGKYYATYAYDGVAIRNVRPTEDEKASYTLRITDQGYCDSVQNAYYDFSNTHGEAMVILSRDNISDTQLLENMMNRSSDWDVYILNSSSQAFESVYNRGYMVELSGSEKLNSLAQSFYPSIQEQITRDGELVAIPVECYGSSGMAVNVKAMEKLGLTEADIPTNWEDLLRFLVEDLPGILPDDGSISLFEDSTDVESARSMLLSYILEDYQSYLEYSGMEQGYDTDILNRALELLDQVDFAALGQPEEIDWNNYEWTWDEEGYLLTYGSGVTPGDYDNYTDNVNLAMSMTADTPYVLSLNCYLAFVNPFSEHVDEAISFLEEATDHLSNRLLYALDPSKTEPIRSSYYEEALEESQKYLEELKQQLEEADEADKQMLEEQVASYEEYMSNMGDYYWEISEKGIKWYQEHNDLVRIDGYNMMYGGDDSSEEIWNLRSQYASKEISAAEFLKGIDKKLQMMILEAG